MQCASYIPEQIKTISVGNNFNFFVAVDTIRKFTNNLMTHQIKFQ